ncbi:TPA: hypothetical protein PXM37_004350, partial [Yersinia enterocolitica]|nr:hypothetical protein [Yersinia enterocolitica]HDL6985370.1 hypothetical protein [Yersinia enterocolitica]HDL7067911.1 hypothetical protein [Yersinia enterocolitica]HDL7072303.1 hypothetical protein [Yersinia enterocolitica]
PVTITATPTAGGAPLSYTFTVTDWFINNGSTGMTWSDAANWCTNQSATQPTRAQLTQGISARGVGSLWSEWGRWDSYSDSGFVRNGYWTSEVNIDGIHHTIYYLNGKVNDVNYLDSNLGFRAICQQSL